MPDSETRQLLPFLGMAPSVGISTFRIPRMAFGGKPGDGGSESSNEDSAVFFGCVSPELYTSFKKFWMIIALVVQSVLLCTGLILALVMLEDKYTSFFESNDGFAIMIVTAGVVFLFSFAELTAYVRSYDEKPFKNKLQVCHVAVYCLAAVLKLWLTGISTFCVIWIVGHEFLQAPYVQEMVDHITATSIVNALFGIFATAFSVALFLASEASRRGAQKKSGGPARA